MIKLTSRTLLAAPFVLVALLASCSKSPAPASASARPKSHFHLAELSKEEVVSLFNVPLADARIRKFEWDFDHPRYVLFIFEQSDDNEKTWRTISKDSLPAPLLTATLICKIEKEYPAKRADDPVRVPLRLRFGGRGPGAFSMSIDSHYDSEFIGGIRQIRTAIASPAEAFVVKGDTRAYRVRLEAQDKAFDAF